MSLLETFVVALKQIAPTVSTVAALPKSQIFLISAALGVTSHRTYFIQSERDLQAWSYFIAILTAPPSLVLLLHFAAQEPILHAVCITTIATNSFLASLFASILVYRLFLHPGLSASLPNVGLDTESLWKSFKVSGPHPRKTDQALLPMGIQEVCRQILSRTERVA